MHCQQHLPSVVVEAAASSCPGDGGIRNRSSSISCLKSSPKATCATLELLPATAPRLLLLQLPQAVAKRSRRMRSPEGDEDEVADGRWKTADWQRLSRHSIYIELNLLKNLMRYLSCHQLQPRFGFGHSAAQKIVGRFMLRQINLCSRQLSKLRQA